MARDDDYDVYTLPSEKERERVEREKYYIRLSQLLAHVGRDVSSLIRFLKYFGRCQTKY